MSQRTFCDRCDQELVLPAEKIDFVTGQPTSGPGDICWRCRLSELVDLYNEKTKDMTQREPVSLANTNDLDPSKWKWTIGPQQSQAHAKP